MKIKLKIWKNGEKKVDMNEENIDIGGLGSLFRSLFLKLSKEKDKLTGTIKEYVPKDNEFITMDEVREVREDEK